MAEIKEDMARGDASSGPTMVPFTGGATNLDTTDPFTTNRASLRVGATQPIKRPLPLTIPDHITADLISYSTPISDAMLTAFKTDTSSLWGKQFVGAWPDDELTVYVVRGLQCDDGSHIVYKVQFEGMVDSLDMDAEEFFELVGESRVLNSSSTPTASASSTPLFLPKVM